MPSSTPPAEQALNERDGRYLRRAIELANEARDRGNRPFGAVIVGADGAVLAEALNRTGETRDCTTHAETEAVRMAAPRYPREVLAGATLYASGEPCVMCSGAIFWSSIRRVVFGIDAVRMRAYRLQPHQRDVELSCRDVFDACPASIECIGPALLDEAAASHANGWQTV